MAVFSADDYSVTVAGVDLSDHLQSVELSVSRAELDTTNFDSSGNAERIGGRKDASVSLNFMQDYAASEVEATIWPLYTSTSGHGTIVIKPTSSSPSSTNPSYTVVALVNDWKPIPAVDPAGLPVASVTWPVSGAVTRGTA